MKKTVKYLILALALGLFLCITALVRMQVRERRHLTTCQNIEIIFRDTLNFISEDEVREYLKQDCPTFTGRRIDSLKLHEIEKMLDSRSAIRSAQAWTADSTLYISIAQREPVARIESASNAYYMDDRGDIFPVQGDCGKRFPIIKGSIPLHEPEKILELLAYMKKNKWNEDFEYIELGQEGSISLIPCQGKEKFIFGKPENVSEKPQCPVLLQD